MIGIRDESDPLLAGGTAFARVEIPDEFSLLSHLAARVN
jgi:hypothetical protein